MPQGLQLWKADGSLKLDTSTLLGRIFGSVNVAAGSASGVITNAKFTQGEPILVGVFGQGTFSESGLSGPAYSQFSYTVGSSGTSVTWSRTTNPREPNLPAGTIFFGVK